VEEKYSLQFKLEYRVFETLFFSLILFITSLEIATALNAIFYPNRYPLKVDSREETLLTASSPCIAYLVHCLSKALSIRVMGENQHLSSLFSKFFLYFPSLMHHLKKEMLETFWQRLWD